MCSWINAMGWAWTEAWLELLVMPESMSGLVCSLYNITAVIFRLFPVNRMYHKSYFYLN
ncbi:hypothetical protein ZOSMA_194G00270 [Zostera marina]|uniref:Uncharacterized protein n=1 Tax=Zostera marina TaxID=29655 RepID=A0A0K9PP85_ZOSMR|nr:hypothetical protein ZOSMA_194G00270 [Zostera marina]